MVMDKPDRRGIGDVSGVARGRDMTVIMVPA
jgi:hypothetical protein